MRPLTLKSTSPLPEAGQLDPHCQCTPGTAHWDFLREILPSDSLEECFQHQWWVSLETSWEIRSEM